MTVADATPLGGFRVLELCEDVAGEYCGKLLADFGAEVVKVENPHGGSPTRRLGPRAAQGAEHERSGLFAYLNTNKRSVALDLASRESAALLPRLLEQADVVIDDHPAGWLEALGLGAGEIEAARPALVLCSITAFGKGPPAERRHAEDLTVFHGSGWGYHTPTGADPTLAPLRGASVYLPSYEAGLEAALCIVAALYERAQSKRGRVIDVSKQAVLASRSDYVLAQMVAGDMDTSTRRDAFDLRGPAAIYPCRDGYVYIWMSTPGHWHGLRELLGAPGWMDEFPERWLEKECTPERVAQCREHLGAWLRSQDKEPFAARAQRLGLIAAAVNDAADLHASPQFVFRKFFTDVKHPVLGAARYPTVPYRLSATPAAIRSPAPRLGEHTREQLAGGRGHG